MRSVTLSLAVLVLACVGQVQAASFIPLGDPGPEWRCGKPHGVSNSGVVVGQTSDEKAFRWTQADGMVSLGVGGTGSCAYGVSADGSVVVGYRRVDIGGDEAFRWTQPSGTAVLPSDPGHARAKAVSADGSVVVGAVSEQACRWTEETGLLHLGYLGDDWLSYANDVSADGSVVVGHSGCCGDEKAFRWMQQDGMVALDGMAMAHAVSTDGSVVVGTHYTSHVEGWRACRWTRETGTQYLGLLPGDSPGNRYEYMAFDVSGDGSLVVGSSYGDDNGAFLWDTPHGMRRLKDVLATDFGLDLTGWDLTHAAAISDNGLHIVGYGEHAYGGYEAWIATIPEPSTFILLATGAFGLAAYVWRRHRPRRDPQGPNRPKSGKGRPLQLARYGLLAAGSSGWMSFSSGWSGRCCFSSG